MLSIIGFALFIMESLTGIVANGFVVLVNGIDWFRSRQLSHTDQILSCLGLSRLFLQTEMILIVPMHFFFDSTYQTGHISSYFFSIWLFTNTLNLWFATYLSCLYFAKIAIFSHPVFLQVKQRISGLIPRLLLSSVIFSVFQTIITMTAFKYGQSICESYLFLSNRSASEIKLHHKCTYIALILVIPNFIPIVLFLLSSGLLITSLRKHMRRLQRNGVCSRDLNTQVHLTAIKALASFAILYLSSFVAVSIQTVLAWRSDVHTLISLFLYNVSALYPSGHAIILILINPKLKQAWIRMLHQLKCCLSKV